MFGVAVLLSALALVFATYAAVKESTFAARSCLVTALVLFVLAIMGAR